MLAFNTAFSDVNLAQRFVIKQINKCGGSFMVIRTQGKAKTVPQLPGFS